MSVKRERPGPEAGTQNSAVAAVEPNDRSPVTYTPQPKLGDTEHGPRLLVGPNRSGALESQGWQDQWVGRRVDLSTLTLPDEAATSVCMLPPTVTEHLVEVSEIVRWDGLYMLMSPVFAGDFKKACLQACCWTYRLGWSDENRQSFAAHLAAHLHLDMFSMGQTQEEALRSDVSGGRWLIKQAKWLVYGGMPPYKLTDTVNPADYYKSPSTPTLSAADAQQYLEAVIVLAEGHPWVGQAGRTDQSVFLYLARHGLGGFETPTITPLGPSSTIAEAVNRHPVTIKKSLRRLRSAGFLKITEGSDWTRATKYVLRWPGPAMLPCVIGSKTSGSDSQEINGVFPDLGFDLSHPAFHQSCLGQAGYRLLLTLSRSGPISSDREWMAAAQVGRSQFYVHKGHLTGGLGVELAERTAADWVLVPDLLVLLDQVAEQSGATAKVKWRHEQSERERQGFARYVAHCRGVDTKRYLVVDTTTTIDRSTGVFLPTWQVLEDPRTQFAGGYRAIGSAAGEIASVTPRVLSPVVCIACGRPVTDRGAHDSCPLTSTFVETLRFDRAAS